MFLLVLEIYLGEKSPVITDWELALNQLYHQVSTVLLDYISPFLIYQ